MAGGGFRGKRSWRSKAKRARELEPESPTLDSSGIQGYENCWVQSGTCETVMDGGGCRVSGFMSF